MAKSLGAKAINWAWVSLGQTVAAPRKPDKTWLREQEVTVHGWVYGLHDGLLQDLHLTADSNASLDAMYAQAVAKVGHSTPRH